MGKYNMFKPPTSLLDGWKTRSSSNGLPISCGRFVGNMDAPSFLAPSQPLDRHCVAKSCQRWMFIMFSGKFLWIFLIAIGTKIPSYWKWPLIICKNRERGCFSETLLREVSCTAWLSNFRPSLSAFGSRGIPRVRCKSMAVQQELQLEVPSGTLT